MSTDLHTLSGAFALDAVSPEEAAAFRTHLEGCAVCRDEVRELRAAAARMGAIEATTPPPALKSRVLEAADRMPQKPPKVPFGRSSTPAGGRSARRRWRPMLAAAATAAVIAVGGGIGLSQMGDDTVPLAAGVAQVFEASDAHVAEVETSHGAMRVATSSGNDEMAVDTSGLRVLDDAHDYQLWTIQDGQPVSVGVLDDLTAGASMPMPEAGTQVAITVEPAGGSEQPTTDPIVQVDPTTV